VATACIRAKGLSNDCYELKLLRKFRDEWVRTQANGAQEISIYYDIAPKIVDKLNQQENAEEIYNTIYNELILKCVKLIEDEKREEAYRLYKKVAFELKDYIDNL
jgi:hypothetical protein